VSLSTSTSPRSVNQPLATLFGAVYIVVGLIGFLVDSQGFAATEGGKILGIFEVNPLHNVAHLAIGALLLFAGRASLAAARSANLAVGASYLLLGVVGLFILDSSANILAINPADNGLHFASALVLLAAGLSADKAVAVRTA
jgi:hypothetical protein